MKLSKIIHPEIVLGRRGSRAEKDYYKFLLNKTYLCDDESHTGTHIHPKNNCSHDEIKELAFIFGRNLNEVSYISAPEQHMACVHKFAASNKKIFYIPRDFAIALSNMKKPLPSSLMPDSYIAYFQFGDGTFDKTKGAYVEIHKGSDDKDVLCKFVVVSSCSDEGQNTCYHGFHEKFLEECNDGNCFLLTDVEQARVYRAAINAVAYIHSSDPEMMKLMPLTNLSIKKRKAASKDLPAENMCTMPITLLSWNYKKGINYHLDSTFVDTYMRWQRHGPGNTLVKLIWVAEHERHFNKEAVQVGQSQYSEGAQNG